MAIYDSVQVQREMNKYGVTWFRMDEISGNVTDSKGSVVGTINGGVTRVSGYEGNGNALNFNGTNAFVQTNQRVFPVGKKSIRFKIKTSQLASSGTFPAVFDTRDTAYAAGSGGGLIALIGSNGNLNITHWYNGVSSVALSAYIADGQWHDMLFTFDGSLMKLYKDDMINPVSTSLYNHSAEVHSFNLVLGKYSTYYFNGQLDSFEVYNDVINPHSYKMLISSDGEYLKYNTSTSQWGVVSTSLPSVQTFIEQGMADLSVLNSNNNHIFKTPMINQGSLGTGRVFNAVINISDYEDFKSLRVQNT